MISLKTRSSRKNLQRRPAPYWDKVQKGVRLGFRKAPGTKPGIWRGEVWDSVAKVYIRWPLATADDQDDADGDRTLSYAQARNILLAKAGKEVAPAVTKTVAGAMEDYLAWFEAHRKSFAETSSYAHAHILPSLGELVVATLTTKQVVAWAESLVVAPIRRHSKRVSVDLTDPEVLRARRATAKRVLGILKAGLNRAHKDDRFPNPDAWQDANPFEDVAVARNRFLDRAECARLLNACDPDFRNVVHAALITGARYGDIRKARVADYDHDNGTWLIPDPKSRGVRKPRHVQLTDDGREFFSSLTIGKTGTEYLFTKSKGARWEKGDQGRRMEVACANGSVDPPATIHELKHTFCSQALTAGMPMWQLSKATGTSMETLERHYGHLSDKELKAAVDLYVPSFGTGGSNVASIT